MNADRGGHSLAVRLSRFQPAQPHLRVGATHVSKGKIPEMHPRTDAQGAGRQLKGEMRTQHSAIRYILTTITGTRAAQIPRRTSGHTTWSSGEQSSYSSQVQGRYLALFLADRESHRLTHPKARPPRSSSGQCSQYDLPRPQPSKATAKKGSIEGDL